MRSRVPKVVRIRPEDKRRLDRLRTQLQRISHQPHAEEDVLSWLVTLGERSKQEFASDATRPLSARETRALMSLPVRTGIRTREEDIDEDIARDAR